MSLIAYYGCSDGDRTPTGDATTDTLEDPSTDTTSDTGSDMESDTALDTDTDPEPDTTLDLVTDEVDDPESDTPLDVDPDAPTTTPGFVMILPGSFQMGSPLDEEDRGTNETQHLVHLTLAFEIMETEVTEDDFDSIMGYLPPDYTSCIGTDCPVEDVSWSEAAAYANALSGTAGLSECYACTGSGTTISCTPSTAFATPYDCPGYRLPTEAEWEYAARAGTTSATYNGTPSADRCNPDTVVDPIAWYCGNASMSCHPVGGKMANPWGLFDMLGNLNEWCHDWYEPFSTGTVTNPWGPSTGVGRIFKGGCWNTYAMRIRAARRLYADPTVHFGIGFRLARTLP